MLYLTLSVFPPIYAEEEGRGEKVEGLHQQHPPSPSGGAKGGVTSSRFSGPPEETDTVSQPRLTPDEAESLFVAVVEAWSSLRCARRYDRLLVDKMRLVKP